MLDRQFQSETLRHWERRQRHTAGLLTMAALAGSLAVRPVQAQAEAQSRDSGPVVPESGLVSYVYPGSPLVWLSEHGNVLRFEGPPGYSHIGINEVSEGYVLCYGGHLAYDLGKNELNFGPSAITCGGSVCIVDRTTTDGEFQLHQVISKVSIERALNVEMTLTKLGSTPVSRVILRRQANFDVDAGGSSGSQQWRSWFGASERESVFAWNATNNTPGEGHAMLLRQIIRKPAYVPYFAKVTRLNLDSSCSPLNLAASGPVLGDYGATIQYDIGDMSPGSVFIGRVQYQRN